VDELVTCLDPSAQPDEPVEEPHPFRDALESNQSTRTELCDTLDACYPALAGDETYCRSRESDGEYHREWPGLSNEHCFEALSREAQPAVPLLLDCWVLSDNALEACLRGCPSDLEEASACHESRKTGWEACWRGFETSVGVEQADALADCFDR
jgi:hypothetical protein